jgi:hypothetical protein
MTKKIKGSFKTEFAELTVDPSIVPDPARLVELKTAMGRSPS